MNNDDVDSPEIIQQMPNPNALNIRVVPIDNPNHPVKLSITPFTCEPSKLHDFLSNYYPLSDAYGMREVHMIRLLLVYSTGSSQRHERRTTTSTMGLI